MSLPESMSRIVIVGAKSHYDEAIEAMYAVKAIHLIDHTVDADEGFDLGTPRPYSSKASERLLKVRAMEKDLGINKHTKAPAIPENEIKSQISSDSVELVEKEIHVVLDKKNDLNQRITDLNATKKNLELLSDIPVDLEMYAGYSTIFGVVGTIAGNPTSGLKDIDAEVFTSFKKKGDSVIAVFAKVQDKEKVQTVLSENGFSEIIVPAGTGSAKDALAAVDAELATVTKELGEVEKEIENLLEKNKSFLRASDEQLAIEVQKGEIPVRVANSEYTFVIDAWVPANKAASVKADLEAKVPAIYVEIEETRGRTLKESEAQEERFQTPPTKFNNGRIVKEFEYPTKLLSFPKYQEIDPTVLIAIFLPMFFGLMVGDVGYSIPFIIIGAYGLKVTHHKDWRAIATVLFFGGIWAFLFGFFFFGECLGMHFLTSSHALAQEYSWEQLLGLDGAKLAAFFSFLPEGTGIGKLHAVTFLLKFSVYIGIVHLLIGYVCALLNKIRMHGFAHGFKEKAGWIFTMVGLVVLCYAMTILLGLWEGYGVIGSLMITLAIGAVLLVIGIIMNFPEEKAQAILEVPGILGNILSYTRLAAIGMSKAGMALAFNYICIGMIYPMIGGIAGFVIALLLFFILHLMIWTLAILSAGLHGLRLQLVELMGKFYEGGGLEYNPLNIKRKQTKQTISTDKITKEA